MSASLKDALMKGLEPEFIVTMETLPGTNIVTFTGLRVLSGVLQNQLRRYGYTILPPQEKDGKIVIFAKKGGRYAFES